MAQKAEIGIIWKATFNIIVALLFSFSFSNAIADEKIKPFKFEWNDDFFGVLEKLKKFDGLKEISIKNIGVDVYKLDRAGMEMVYFQNLFGSQPGTSEFKEMSNRLIVENFKDKDGNPAKYIKKGFDIKAFPVIIKGIPFELTVVLDIEPGHLVTSPENVIVTDTERFKIHS